MKTSSSKKAPLKMLRVLDPIKTSPFVVPTTRKEASTGNAPMGATPQSKSFSSGRGKPNFRGSRGHFRPHSSKASLSPPVGGRLHSFRRDWKINKCSDSVLNIITNGYVFHSSQNQNWSELPKFNISVSGLLNRKRFVQSNSNLTER